MELDELTNLFDIISKLDFNKLPVCDQLFFTMECIKFAEAVKPIIAKNLDKTTSNETFIVKI